MFSVNVRVFKAELTPLQSAWMRHFGKRRRVNKTVLVSIAARLGMLLASVLMLRFDLVTDVVDQRLIVFALVIAVILRLWRCSMWCIGTLTLAFTVGLMRLTKTFGLGSMTPLEQHDVECGWYKSLKKLASDRVLVSAPWAITRCLVESVELVSAAVLVVVSPWFIPVSALMVLNIVMLATYTMTINLLFYELLSNLNASTPDILNDLSGVIILKKDGMDDEGMYSKLMGDQDGIQN